MNDMLKHIADLATLNTENQDILRKNKELSSDNKKKVLDNCDEIALLLGEIYKSNARNNI